MQIINLYKGLHRAPYKECAVPIHMIQEIELCYESTFSEEFWIQVILKDATLHTNGISYVPRGSYYYTHQCAFTTYEKLMSAFKRVLDRINDE